MAEKESKSGMGDWPAIVTTLTLLIGALWVNQAADTPRPSPPLKGDGVRLIQDADARLWQDPFDAIARHRETKHKKDECYRLTEETGGGQHTVTALIKHDGGCGAELKPELNISELNRLINSRAEKVAVLGVMVNGGPYVGADEFRRQTRYAVLSGLKEQKYLPVDAQHLGHLSLNNGHLDHLPVNNEENEGYPEVVPFEWLEIDQEKDDGRPKNDNNHWVLVLWLNEEAFDGEFYDSEHNGKESPASEYRPLMRLTVFFDELLKDGKKNIPLRVIGPSNSTTLMHMVLEWEKSVQDKSTALTDRINNHQLRFYSPWASINDETLEYPLNRIHLQRIGPDDSKLAKALQNELQLRDAANPNQMVLISQWDTAYARGLVTDIMRAVTKKTGCHAGADTSADNQADKQPDKQPDPKDCITRYTFLRGLDGKLADNQSPLDRNKPGGIKDAESAKSASDQNNDDRSDGNAQIDYLRRIRDDMLKKDNSKLPIRAIGLIADDYYDKLLILSILKPAFPEAVFFTTDLDANMFNSSDDRQTRNLIVASAFGLALNSRLQNNTPPFRTSTQTAAYLAVQAAMQTEADNQHSIGENWEPNVFEIGRTKPVDLEPDQNGIDCKIENLSECNNPHNKASFTDFQSLGVPAILAVIFLILLSYFLGGAWGFGVGLVFIIFLYTNHDEPFYLAEGVSIWPSELMRILAIQLAIYFLSEIRAALKLSDREISQYFFKQEPEKITAKQPETQWRQLSLDQNNAGKINCCLIEILYLSYRILLSILFLFQRIFSAILGKRFPRNIAGPQTLGHFINAFIMRGNIFRWEKQFAEWKKTGRPDYPIHVMKDAWGDFLNEPVITLSFFHTILFMVMGIAIFKLWGEPSPMVPARGDAARIIDHAIIALAVSLFIFTLFYINNATCRVARLAKKLWGRTEWESDVLRRYGFPSGVKDSEDEDIGFENWLDIQLIARCTEAVKPLIVYPIILLFLMVFARSRLFDAWSIPLPLFTIYTASLIIAVLGALRLRRTVESTRNHGVKYLNICLMRAKARKGLKTASGKEDYDTLAEQLEIIIKDAKSLNQGSFSPFTELAPILAMIASLSSLQLIDYFQFG